LLRGCTQAPIVMIQSQNKPIFLRTNEAA